MRDRISSRIRRIITGSANSIVARIEGLAPAMILEQAIAEVDSAIDEVRAELGNALAQKHHVSKAIARLNSEHETLAAQIEQAHGAARRDLVEAGLSRQIDIEDQLPAIEHQLSELLAQEQELNAAITGLVAKRNEMEDELFAFRRTEQQAGNSRDGDSGARGTPAARVAAAESAFTRTLQQATGVRHDRLRSASAEGAKLLELADLNKQARIEARLRALAAAMPAADGTAQLPDPPPSSNRK
ncbi:MAG: hypothetical protein EA400_13220 [Chromatiaceae bacterium]|nr:MAG: hypothetical protein EA400_13220 [Chromatiaceae bacterium]